MIRPAMRRIELMLSRYPSQLLVLGGFTTYDVYVGQLSQRLSVMQAAAGLQHVGGLQSVAC